MILDNSFKIFLNKANLMWKVLLYQIVCLCFLVGILFACCSKLFWALSGEGYLTEVKDFFTNNFYNFNLGNILQDLYVLINKFLDIIATNPSLILYLVLFFAILFIVGSMLFSLSKLPLNECIYGTMGSFSKLNFMGFYVSEFLKSMRFALSRLVTIVVVDIGIFACLFGLLKLFDVGGIVVELLPFIIILAGIILISLRQSLFSMWQSSIVVNKFGVWKGFKDNFRNVFKNFKTIFGNTLIITILAFAVNYGLAILTCGVGLLLSVPATILYFNVMYMTMYFEFNGLKYYVDKDKIVSPKKLEDREKIKDIKTII